METERAQNFQDRLNQWIASQGFWFQLKYSMSRPGGGGSVLYHMIRMAFRLMVFSVIVGIGAFIYLYNRTDREAYRKDLEISVLSALGAKDGSLGTFKREQGKFSISRISSSGKAGTFYTELDVRNISGQMSAWDGFVGTWDTGMMPLSRLDIDLRAGVADADLARTMGAVLFREHPGLEISGFDVEDATVTWGYSAVTRGVIERSHLKIVKTGSGWHLVFKGGKFSQNWLKDFDILELVVACRPDGVTVEKALFQKDGGTLDMSGLRISGAEQPVVSGVAKLKGVPLSGTLTTMAESVVEGRISGNLQVGGSTNSAEGVTFQGRILLGNGDSLSLRDKLHLLKTLKGVDAFNNYRRVEFTEGSFDLKTGGGNLQITGIDLKAGDAMTMKGSIKGRQPTPEEKRRFLPDLPVDDKVTTGPNASSKKPAKKDAVKKNDAKDFDREDQRLAIRKAAETSANSLSDIMSYEGEILLTLKPEVFEKSGKLIAEYPVDPKSGRIPLKVPVNGFLGSLTLKQAEEIYQKSQER